MITLKLLLRLFAHASGLHINYDKSSFLPLNLSMKRTQYAALILGCAQTSLPIQYLGMPLTLKKPSRCDFVPVMFVGLIQGVCGGWQGGGSPLRAVSEVMKK